jgi:hypothetical protein
MLSMGAAKADDKSIVGKWSAAKRTKGGLGTTLIFNDDGSMSHIFGALVDFKYQADGKELKTINDADNSVISKEPYEIDGDKLIINPTDPKAREERSRVGKAKPGSAAIVGVWSFKHYTGVMSTWQYTTGGLAQLSVPMQTVKGHYKLANGELTVEMEGQPAVTRKVILSGDRLTLGADGDKPEQKFTRVAP